MDLSCLEFLFPRRPYLRSDTRTQPSHVETMHRRQFLKSGSLGLAAGLVGPSHGFASKHAQKRIYNAVKWTMIKGDHLSVLDKFKLSKDVGFDGISLMGHDWVTVKDVLQACDKTDLPVHNVNGANHWKVRLSDPDPVVRKQAKQDLRDTIQFSSDVGGDSVLVVVGKVTDPINENHDQVWERSTEIIKDTLPLAARLGVRILFENVGNDFCLTPKLWNQYIDQFESPWVGAFFDIGNHHSRGGAAEWLRAIGNRIVKLDVKGHSTERRKNCDIFDGDIPWEKVREEIQRIHFTGWATAEVSGGGEDRLRQVVQNMDRALGIA